MDTINKKCLVFEAYPFFSGAQKINLNLCKVLKANNYTITLLIADNQFGILEEKFRDFVDEIVIAPTDKRLTQYGNSKQWFSVINFIRSILFGVIPFYVFCIKLFLKKKFDYFYFCDPRGATMIAPPAFFFRGKKIVYLQSKNRLGKFLATFIYQLLNNEVVCASSDVADSLPFSKKKSVINYGVDYTQYGEIYTDTVQAEIEFCLAKRNLNKNNRAVLLYAGLMKPQKGVHHLIYALSKLKNVMPEKDLPILFMLGESKTEAEHNYIQNLQQFLQENNVSHYVFWMGFKNNILEWMQSANYLIFPTIDKENCFFQGFEAVIESTEGSPTVLIEASICNLFSIAANVTGVEEIITNNENGLKYNPNNKEELFNLLKDVLKDKPSFKTFPNKDLFSADTFASKFLSVFK